MTIKSLRITATDPSSLHAHSKAGGWEHFVVST